MRVIERVEALVALLAAAGGTIEGRIKLHKLAYLCQMRGTDLGQDFTFHLYGVFSPSLYYDVRRAISWGLVEEVTSGAKVTTRLCMDSGPGTSQPGFSVVERLAPEPSRVLELLSTIVYLSHVGYKGMALANKLMELKGHLREFQDRAWCLAQDIFGVERAEVDGMAHISCPGAIKST